MQETRFSSVLKSENLPSRKIKALKVARKTLSPSDLTNTFICILNCPYGNKDGRDSLLAVDDIPTIAPRWMHDHIAQKMTIFLVFS